MDVLGPLTLRPGDRRIRAVISRARPVNDPWWVERACVRCGSQADAQRGAVVVYGPHDSTTTETGALCSVCAPLLTPIRFAIDLHRHRPDATTSSIGGAALALAERIATMRCGPSPDVVWTRARDVHALARRLGTTRTGLALALQDLGVLAAVDVATGPSASCEHSTNEGSTQS